MLHIRDVLRSGLNAQILATIAEASGSPASSGLEQIANTTHQIELGDHSEYAPQSGFFPAVRIAAPDVEFLPMSSSGVIDARVTTQLGIYCEQIATQAECAEDVIDALSQTSLDLVESVRACLERDLTSSVFGDRSLVLGYNRTDAPQDPERPCVLRIRYELTFQSIIRMRHSRGAA